MSIVIDMPMPVGCVYEGKDGQIEYCPLCNHDDVPYCQYLDDYEAAIGIQERPCYCPIKAELPEKHGRLIDADALELTLISAIVLMTEFMKNFGLEDEGMQMELKAYRDILNGIKEGPTIFESEGDAE